MKSLLFIGASVLLLCSNSYAEDTNQCLAIESVEVAKELFLQKHSQFKNEDLSRLRLSYTEDGRTIFSFTDPLGCDDWVVIDVDCSVGKFNWGSC